MSKHTNISTSNVHLSSATQARRAAKAASAEPTATTAPATKSKGWGPPDASQRHQGPTPLPPARLDAQQKQLLSGMSEQGQINFQKSLAFEQLVTGVLQADAKANGGRLSQKGQALLLEVRSNPDYFGSPTAQQLVRDLTTAPPKAPGAKTGLEGLSTDGPVGQGIRSQPNWMNRVQDLVNQLEARQQQPQGPTSLREMAGFWKQLIQSIR
ncbi:MAG: hypothetical protein K1X89_18675 [Myxococcaceae bacterium]|nr:hypothetical protein [Myxococcaceae bacterium]